MAPLKNTTGSSNSLFALSDSTALDPKLASLFSAASAPSSLLQARRKTTSEPQTLPSASQRSQTSPQSDSSSKDSQPLVALQTSLNANSEATNHDQTVQSQQPRRKRKRDNEDLEGRYLQKLAREEARETNQRQAERAAKLPKEPSDLASNEVNHKGDRDKDSNGSNGEDDSDMVDMAGDDSDDDPVPLHESLAQPEDDPELQKASRTVFLANVSTAAMTSKTSKRTLLNHLSSIFSTSADSETKPKIESLRFRSTAYSNAVPKKAAFARKDLMDATTKSTNAYAVYSTNQAAREAAQKLNGTVVLGRHLRVDEVAHPAKIDHHRCVFVGNLGFVDDESRIEANTEADGKKRKPQKGDVEEGLWQQFGKAGTVESVRVVRDPKTRVGKGFAYVQFSDENSVEAALLFNDKKFPPMLPRKLRVVRAKKVRKDGSTGSKPAPSSQRSYNSSKSNTSGTADSKTLQGRVKKLLGRAGAAQLRKQSDSNTKKSGGRGVKPPESFVFEGHRASSTQGNRGLKLGGSQRKKGGKPKSRSAKRGAAWKAGGGKKSGSSKGSSKQ